MVNFEKTPGRVINAIKHLVDMLPTPARHRLLRLVNRHILSRPHPLALAAGLRPKKKTAHGFTVVTAVYNTAPYLDDFFISLARQSIRPEALQIVVVDDGSTDGTAEVLAATGGVEIITFPENRGKGQALRTGLARADERGFSYALTIDADGQHYPEDIPLFLQQQ